MKLYMTTEKNLNKRLKYKNYNLLFKAQIIFY